MLLIMMRPWGMCQRQVCSSALCHYRVSARKRLEPLCSPCLCVLTQSSSRGPKTWETL